MSNSDVAKCPSSHLPEYAFIGRSNVGKSSLINMLMQRKNLAKTSGRPGKTQLINHFLVNKNWHLVDLPGYGYAKVSKKSKKTFQKFITEYFPCFDVGVQVNFFLFWKTKIHVDINIKT